MASTPDFKHPISIGPTWSQAISLGDINDTDSAVIVGRVDNGGNTTNLWYDMRPSIDELDYLDSAEIIEIASDSSSDTAAGIGARAVLVEGVGNDFKALSETVVLNGLTSVPTVNAYKRVNRLVVVSAGSSGENQGGIFALAQVAGTTQCEIITGLNISTQTNYAIPDGKTFLLDNIVISAGKNDEVELAFASRPAGLGSPFTKNSSVYAYESFFEATNLNTSFEGPTDIKVMARNISTNPRILVILTGVLL